MNRRDFLKLSAAGAGAALTGTPPLPGQTPTATAPRQGATVAIPICAAPLVQKDFEHMLADMRERAGVNALMPFVYSHEEHRAGIYTEGFRGGNYATPHMQYYKDTNLTYEDMKAPELGKVDVFETSIPLAKKHGIRMFAWLIEDNHCPAIPNWEKHYEVDFHGRRTNKHPGGPCNNNPLYRGYLLGAVEDYMRSYDIGGIMWGSERQSGLLNALGIDQGGPASDPGRVTCFCEFCQKKGRDKGIDVERARKGFGEIETFVRQARTTQRPRDGYFTTFWRILIRYPELLAWENLWVEGRHELQAELHRKAKSINPDLPIGWHVWHNSSFSPFQRAEEDYAVLKGFSDFIRPALYNNCAGERYKNFVKGARSSVFGDLEPAEASGMFFHQLGYPNETPYDQLAKTGLSADYVERETRRAAEGVADTSTQIWPGVDIDVPVPPGASRCTPESVAAAVKGAFKGGAKGIILSRNYVEMKPDNLSGAGAALREMGVI